MPEIDAEIDLLTQSVIHQPSAQVLPTIIVRYRDLTESQRGQSASWRFDWAAERSRNRRDVLGLLVDGSETLQGLISLESTEDHVLIHLLESAPHNVGQNKLYRGVAGNLFAYACMKSFQLGFQGFVGFVAKTELIEHYTHTLGARQVGSSGRMIIDTESATRLVQQYFKEQDQWPS